MQVTVNRRWVRWIPAAAVPAVVAIGLLASGATAVSPPPPATPAQVLALAAGHSARQFSGTLEETADLGLPAIPGQALGAAKGSSTLGSEAALLELLTVPHTAKVYADGPARIRVQVMDQLAERDAIRNGSDAWTYDSAANTVTHVTLPAGSAETAPGTLAMTPEKLAQRFLAAADASTDVSLGAPTAVAGHSSYTLVLTPKASGTLIARVKIAVEAQTGLPLAVDVFAKGQQAPAFNAAYTQLDLKAPDASVFAFSPPPGAKITEQQLPASPGAASQAQKDHPQKDPSQKPAAGTPQGWDAVVVIPKDKVPAGFTDQPLVKQLSTPAAGGRVISSSLFTVFLADDGRVLAGAVPASTLEAKASGTTAK
ncbi:LolA family protein [Sinomonas sp. P10A9]|uniref:Outer membrane lipoprotein carrier protein LolA n=1 Tax=Sinomonas puerhi TaxID=3238584 RepID=A0AB39L8Q2_9MICC